MTYVSILSKFWEEPERFGKVTSNYLHFQERKKNWNFAQSWQLIFLTITLLTVSMNSRNSWLLATFSLFSLFFHTYCAHYSLGSKVGVTLIWDTLYENYDLVISEKQKEVNLASRISTFDKNLKKTVTINILNVMSQKFFSIYLSGEKFLCSLFIEFKLHLPEKNLNTKASIVLSIFNNWWAIKERIRYTKTRVLIT